MTRSQQGVSIMAVVTISRQSGVELLKAAMEEGWTIAWRIVHVSLCKLMYHEYAFGPAKLTWDELVVPHTAVDAIASLEENHVRLRAVLDGLSDDDLVEMRLTNWGEYWPTWRIFWVMAAHDVGHGGEIACLRDLYRMQHQTKGGR
jgi:hypothetical protein